MMVENKVARVEFQPDNFGLFRTLEMVTGELDNTDSRKYAADALFLSVSAWTVDIPHEKVPQEEKDLLPTLATIAALASRDDHEVQAMVAELAQEKLDEAPADHYVFLRQYDDGFLKKYNQSASDINKITNYRGKRPLPYRLVERDTAAQLDADMQTTLLHDIVMIYKDNEQYATRDKASVAKAKISQYKESHKIA